VSEKVVRIEMEYADGKVQRLTGPEAERWIGAVNGAVFNEAVRYGTNRFVDFNWEWTTPGQSNPEG
jgi:hypothetical protein